MVVVLATTLATASAACDQSPRRRDVQTSSRERPNVLIIVTDDQRPSGTLSVMPRTRRLFKKDGTRFPHAFATTPLCCPSRASILTGRYAHNHGVVDNLKAENLDESLTLQARLSRLGYHTGFFGKFLNHWDVNREPRFFDDWALFPGDSDAVYYRNGIWNLNGTVRRVSEYATTFVESRTVEFLERAEAEDERPWLVFVFPTAPHTPFEPEPRYEEAAVSSWRGNPALRERDRRDKLPFEQTRACSLQCALNRRRAQLRTLMSVDDLVAELFRTLSVLGEERDTMAFFLSDNGYLWGEHGIAGKDVPYLESVKIPMLARLPGRARAGATDGRLVANIDIAPTVLDAAGGPESELESMDGRSLLDVSWEREVMFLEYRRGEGRDIPSWESILTPSFQYIEYYKGDEKRDDGVMFREYYDLESDPFQLDNLLGDSLPGNDPGLRGLSSRLASYRTCKGDACP